ncbi:MAG TPA: DUF1990 family protein [Flavobacteriales bacterium]|nr:DUF1990 family protein [Flavobacteriales bacterium]
MKIYLVNQKHKFKKHLDFLKTQKVMPYEKQKLRQKTTTIQIDTTKSFDSLNLDFLFNYQIFPENIMAFKTQWEDENRKMKVGDTILQQVFIPPTKTVSQKLIFGVRISEIIDEPFRKGFSYETLEGHVEKGVSTFTLEKLSEQIIFRINTFSTGGNFFTRLLGPVFSVPYQAFCTKRALTNVKRQIEIL